MKTINDINIDVWKETEVCRFENEHALIFLAPDQAWTRSAVNELNEAGVYLAGETAVMEYDGYVVLGFGSEGIIRFEKKDPDVRKYLIKSSSQDFAVTLTVNDARLLGERLTQLYADNVVEHAKKKITKNEAYRTHQCRHCVYLDDDTGFCLAEDPDSDSCPK